MFLEWDEKYSLGIERIDEQHKILFSIIADVYEALAKGKQVEDMVSVLDSMVFYTKVHFMFEEKHMLEQGFDEVDEHIKEHRYFVDCIEKFRKNIQERKESVGHDVLQFLVDWLTSHILVNDMKLSRARKSFK